MCSKKNMVALTVLTLVAVLFANESYKLVYRIDKGTTLRYRMTSSMEQTVEVMGTEQNNESRSTSVVTLIGEAPDEQGNLRFIWRADSVVINVKNVMMDSTIRNPEWFVGRRVRHVITPYGDQLSVEELDTVEVKDPMFAQMARMKSEFLPNLPTKELKVGDQATVTDVDTTEMMGGSMVTNTEVTYTLAGKETVQGYDCLKLTYTGTTELEGEGSYQGMMKFFMEGEMEMQGVLYFAPKEGVLVSNEAEIDSEMTAAFSGQQNMTMPISQVTTTKMVLLP